MSSQHKTTANPNEEGTLKGAGTPPKILLLYPALGFADQFVKNIPLSLVYCVTDAIKAGYAAEIVDFRLPFESEESVLRKKLTPDVAAVGISVMSGIPTAGAARLSRLVRKYSAAKIVWGGPHTTILPAETVAQNFVDYAIRGYGSRPLKMLLDHITGKDVSLSSIPGLCFKGVEAPHIAEINADYEFFDFHDLPYFLLEPTLEQYFDEGVRNFPIYSAAGCPYQCTFCISPVWYRGNRKKWIPFPTGQVLDHMEYLIGKYRVNFIYLYDDDSFVDTSNFMEIAKGVKKRGLGVKIGVRGIRVNELEKLKDEDFALLQEVGITTLHIGLESGSQRILDLMGKRIRVEKSLEMNRRLAKFPNLIPMYNLLSGIPTETLDDLRMTKDLMVQVCKENPRCILLGPGKFIPYPGSELYALALRHGFEPPATMEEWAKLDQEGDLWMPWYTHEYNQYINMLYVATNILDNRLDVLHLAGSKRLVLKILKTIYLPIAWIRLKTGYSGFLIEYPMLKFFLKKFKF